MNQLYELPDGRIVRLYDHPIFRPVRWCPKCRRMVSKWHEHVPKPRDSNKAPPRDLP